MLRRLALAYYIDEGVEMGCLAIFVACGVFALFVAAVGGGSYLLLTEVFGVSDANAGEASGCIVLLILGLSVIIGVIWSDGAGQSSSSHNPRTCAACREQAKYKQ